MQLSEQQYLQNSITNIQDFPKKGIIFRDITSLIEDHNAFHLAINEISQHYKDKGINKIIVPEARGFIFGAAVAAKIDAGLVLIRKPGKLPRKTIEEEYSLEYGTNKVYCHVDSISEGERLLLIDDLLATGGTAIASIKLARRLGGIVEDAAFVINLFDLKGEENLANFGVKTFSLVNFSGE